MTHRTGRGGKRSTRTRARARPPCPACGGAGACTCARDHEIAAAHLAAASRKHKKRKKARSYSGPASQTQEFQKQYRGPRIYAETVEKGYETRGAAGVGGAQWTPPPGERARRAPAVDNRGALVLASDPPRPGYILAGHPRHRRYGVPGIAPGAPGWAGAGGIAQAPGPGCKSRGGRGQGGGPGHGYGSLGSERSMGDGSMDMAAGGERMRRYAMTWRYENVCPTCGGSS